MFGVVALIGGRALETTQAPPKGSVAGADVLGMHRRCRMFGTTAATGSVFLADIGSEGCGKMLRHKLGHHTCAEFHPFPPNLLGTEIGGLIA